MIIDALAVFALSGGAYLLVRLVVAARRRRAARETVPGYSSEAYWKLVERTSGMLKGVKEKPEPAPGFGACTEPYYKGQIACPKCGLYHDPAADHAPRQKVQVLSDPDLSITPPADGGAK